MTRDDLAKRVAKQCGIPVGAARAVVVQILDGMTVALSEGSRVELRGFGTLRPRHYPGYLGRDPRNGAPVNVPAKVLPVFKPSGALLRRLNPMAEAVGVGAVEVSEEREL